MTPCGSRLHILLDHSAFWRSLFFFQAEDGIRDVAVTGVQTCALPIFDGHLQAQTETELRVAAALALRLKLMAGLDISEKRHPQDGRFNVLVRQQPVDVRIDRKSTRLNSSHGYISYAVFCLKKKTKHTNCPLTPNTANPSFPSRNDRASSHAFHPPIPPTRPTPTPTFADPTAHQAGHAIIIA